MHEFQFSEWVTDALVHDKFCCDTKVINYIIIKYEMLILHMFSLEIWKYYNI